MQADVGLAVGGEVLERLLERRRDRVERRERGRVGALGGQHRDAQLDGEALVADLAPFREHPARGRVGGRLGVGDERAAAAAAGGEHVAALGQRGQRLAQRRAGDAQPRAQLPLGGQLRAGGQQARA